MASAIRLRDKDDTFGNSACGAAITVRWVSSAKTLLLRRHSDQSKGTRLGEPFSSSEMLILV
jgi:hypothetical protein